jgi:hypothetical protein
MRAQIALLVAAALVCGLDAQSAPFISEIHYDNTGVSCLMLTVALPSNMHSNL